MRRPWLGPTLAALVAALIVAGVSGADQLIGVGGGYWSSRIASTTSSGCVQEFSDSAATCALFPAGAPEDYRMAVISAGGAGRCGFTLTSSATLGDGFWDSDNYNGRGGGDIRSFEAAGQEWHTRPNWNTLRFRPTGAQGICAVAETAGVHGEPVMYRPCHRDDNCTTGACTLPSATNSAPWTSAQLTHVGAFLVCESDSGTVNFNVRKERVRR